MESAPAPEPAAPDAPAGPAPLAQFLSDIEQSHDPDYVRLFLRQHRSNTVVRLGAGVTPVLEFQSEALKNPVSPMRDRKAAKFAPRTFDLILKYTGVKKGGSPAAVQEIFKAIRGRPDLCDEVFLQLVKQTRSNPNPDALARTWDLLLIVATCFPSSPNLAAFIKAHLAKTAASGQERIADIARFTFIRFSARCLNGSPLDPVTPEMIQRIPREPFNGTMTFGASVHEQLWNQRTTFPRLPFPHVLHVLSRIILEKDGARTEGIFRRSGNATTVEEVMKDVNKGVDLQAAFAHVHLSDAAQLFKMWFMFLPERIISAHNYQKLRRVYDTNKDYVTFLDEIVPAHAVVLKFLVGLLRELLPHERTTKMGPMNYAIVFASSVAPLPSFSDGSEALTYAAVSQEFLAGLIENLDPAGIYPVPESLLAH
jgi:hypothetical protein